MKKALITGIAGQDGSYLAELLLEKGYEVYGIAKNNKNLKRIEHIIDKIKLFQGDITDQNFIEEVIKEVRPDEVYNLAGISFIPYSWENPMRTIEVNAFAVLKILEVIRKNKHDTKFYQASSSEMFGKAVEVPQKETTPFHPVNPYGVSKVLAHYITLNYRKCYNIFASSGICFNHESPRRGTEYVTRKITYTIAKIVHGKEKTLRVGNIEARRDWGYAGDYVYAMWLILQQDEPDDYIIATGETHSVREFIEIALDYVGIKIEWDGEGEKCKGIVKFANSKLNQIKPGDIVVETDPKLFRPLEPTLLVGDASKAKIKLGWKPKVKFEELVRMMMESDLNIVKYEN